VACPQSYSSHAEAFSKPRPYFYLSLVHFPGATALTVRGINVAYTPTWPPSNEHRHCRAGSRITSHRRTLSARMPLTQGSSRIRSHLRWYKGKLQTSHNMLALPASRVWLFHVSNLTTPPTLTSNYFQMETLPSAAQCNWRQCSTRTDTRVKEHQSQPVVSAGCCRKAQSRKRSTNGCRVYLAGGQPLTATNRRTGEPFRTEIQR
jgi:hypothetical protein